LYDVAACEVTSEGMVTLHHEIRPHGWLVARRLPLAVTPHSGSARVERVRFSEVPTFTVSTESTCRVKVLSVTPSTPCVISVDDSERTPVSSDAEGRLVFDVPAGTHLVSVKHVD